MNSSFFSRTGFTRGVALSLLAMMAGVCLMSFFAFSRQSLRLDEAQSLWQTSHSLSAMMKIVGEDVHVPLYHTLLHFWQFFLGNSVEVARILSLLFFLCSIPALYFLGASLYGARAGLFASLLFTVSPFMNWYGNEIRMYSLYTFLAILNHYFFVHLYRSKEGRGPWLLYALTAVLGVYTHYFFVFVLLAQVFFFFTHRSIFPKDAFRKFLVTALIVVIAFSPWLWWVYSLGGASNERPLIAAPTTSNLFNTFSQFLFGFQDDHINSILLSFWPISVLLAFLALRRGVTLSPDTEYFLTAFLVPIIAAFGISFIFQPIYLTRYLIMAIPPLYLCLAALMEAYPDKLRSLIRGILIVAMVGMLALEVVSAATPVKENYRDVADYLQHYALPEDVVVASAPFTIYPLEYYYQGPSTIDTLPLWDRSKTGAIPAFSEDRLPTEISQIKENHVVLWLVLSYDQGYEHAISTYFDAHYERLLAKNFSPGLNLYAYKLRYDTNRTFPFSTTTPATVH